jgi:hypothetical protein
MMDRIQREWFLCSFYAHVVSTFLCNMYNRYRVHAIRQLLTEYYRCTIGYNDEWGPMKIRTRLLFVNSELIFIQSSKKPRLFFFLNLIT